MMNDDLPFVPLDVIDYLNAVYTKESLLDAKVDNNDELVGYMKGVTEVIAVLTGLATRKE